MTAESYRFDRLTGEYVMIYTEQVPPWFMANKRIFRALGVFALIGFIHGVSSSWLWLLIWLFVGLMVARIAPAIGGNQFQRELRVRADTGAALLTVEYGRWYGGPHEHRFSIDEVASVERSSFAHDYPDAIADLQKNNGNLSLARRLEAVNIVFTDGQQIDGGWRDTANKAAQLQSQLITLFAAVREHMRESTRQRQRTDALIPGDALL